MSEDQGSQPVFQIQHYQFQEDQEKQYRSKEYLIKQYAQKRNSALDENQKLLAKARKLSQEKVSLIIVKSLEKSTLNIVIVEEDKLFEIKINMDQINVLDKIHLHKQTSKVFYADLSKYFLDNKKIESKVSKL
jgi:hypothetical protein